MTPADIGIIPIFFTVGKKAWGLREQIQTLMLKASTSMTANTWMENTHTHKHPQHTQIELHTWTGE